MNMKKQRNNLVELARFLFSLLVIGYRHIVCRRASAFSYHTAFPEALDPECRRCPDGRRFMFSVSFQSGVGRCA